MGIRCFAALLLFFLSSLADRAVSYLDPDLGTARVVFQTEYGDIEFGFFPHVAPKTVEHIFKLVRLGCYNTNHFFRVDKGFVAQVADVVGGRSALMNEEQRLEAEKTVIGEFSRIKHVRGILSMGRYSDPDSASSSFSILLGDAPHLDGQYAIFGKMTKGDDTLRRLEELPTRREGIFVMPTERITIFSTYYYDANIENCETEKQSLKRRLSESLIEVERQEGEKGKFARVCVLLNIREPIQQRFWIDTELGSFFQSISYENLPFICFKRGRVKHGENVCKMSADTDNSYEKESKKDAQSSKSKEEEVLLGPWVQVHRRKKANHVQNTNRSNGGNQFKVLDSPAFEEDRRAIDMTKEVNRKRFSEKDAMIGKKDWHKSNEKGKNVMESMEVDNANVRIMMNPVEQSIKRKSTWQVKHKVFASEEMEKKKSVSVEGNIFVNKDMKMEFAFQAIKEV
ncbi:peptidyl-prolyl cis-trans isomerase CYP23 [Canna indica]|uniref:Peptidyl-prolyl cis-trans isomerase CYP23 n=1 Tax=Canna indica TaxID=4628 RepID=A0AAQ3K4N7_9LILI|nr:peptidyl-prolyl cis-trans isomerase CYP23 [Canna indica]